MKEEKCTTKTGAKAQLRAKLLTYENKIVSGRVFKYDGMGNIYVNVLLDDMPAGETIIGKCIWKHQTPKERCRYNTEDLYHFYVLKVHAFHQDGVPTAHFDLSRTSWSLVRLLLLQYANGIKPDDYKIKVTCRIAGKFSHVNTNKPLPKAAIQRVAQELRERMPVKYDMS